MSVLKLKARMVKRLNGVQTGFSSSSFGSLVSKPALRELARQPDRRLSNGIASLLLLFLMRLTSLTLYGKVY
jgi:hypothetical protein